MAWIKCFLNILMELASNTAGFTLWPHSKNPLPKKPCFFQQQQKSEKLSVDPNGHSKQLSKGPAVAWRGNRALFKVFEIIIIFLCQLKMLQQHCILQVQQLNVTLLLYLIGITKGGVLLRYLPNSCENLDLFVAFRVEITAKSHSVHHCSLLIVFSTTE